MARKKKETDMQQTTDVLDGAMAVTVDVPAPVEVPPQQAPVMERPPDPPPQNGNGTRRPAANWRYPAAGGVTIEVALWPHTITLQSGEQIEVLNATITRNYKDQAGQWCRGGSFRVPEIPVLVHALMR